MATSKYWCIPFYYNQGFGLGDVTSDEDESKNKELLLDKYANLSRKSHSCQSLEPLKRTTFANNINSNILIRVDSNHSNSCAIAKELLNESTGNRAANSEKLEISDEVRIRKNSNNSLVPKQYRYTRAKSAETGLRPPGIVKKLSFNLETQEIIPNGFYPAEQCSDNEDELDAYFKNYKKISNCKSNIEVDVVKSSENEQQQQQQRSNNSTANQQEENINNKDDELTCKIDELKLESSNNQNPTATTTNSSNNKASQIHLKHQESVTTTTTTSFRKSIRDSLSIKNKRLKRMLRKESKSHSPSFSNHAPPLGQATSKSCDSPQPSTAESSDSSSNKIKNRRPTRFGTSIDTYRRLLSVRLSKDKSVEEDTTTATSTSTSLRSPLQRQTSQIQHDTSEGLGVTQSKTSPVSPELSLSNKSLKSLFKSSGNEARNFSTLSINRMMLTAPSFIETSLSAPSSPSFNKKHENYSRSLSKEYSITESSTSMPPNSNSGRICMRVLYDSNTHVLTVSLIQSNKLLSAEKAKLFSKVQFQINLANKEKAPRYKSTTKEYNEIINYNENFYFPNIEKECLPSYSIILNLFGKETFGSDKLISQANYPLGKLHLNNHYNYLTLYLEEIKKSKSDSFSSINDLNSSSGVRSSNAPNSSSNTSERPSLYVGLKYEALLGNLYVEIIKGNNLVDRYASDKSPNTFVRVILEVDKTEVKHQTAVKRSSSSPVYEESFEFSLGTYQVENAKLFIYIYSKRLFSSKNLIGCIIFDDQPGHNEYVTHLKEAITNDGEDVKKWHYLQFY